MSVSRAGPVRVDGRESRRRCDKFVQRLEGVAWIWFRMWASSAGVRKFGI